MKVSIDREGCIECGGCELVCSEVFKLDDDNKASIVKKYRNEGPDEGKVDDGLLSCVKEAIETCPVYVIKMEPLTSI